MVRVESVVSVVAVVSVVSVVPVVHVVPVVSVVSVSRSQTSLFKSFLIFKLKFCVVVFLCVCLIIRPFSYQTYFR